MFPRPASPVMTMPLVRSRTFSLTEMRHDRTNEGTTRQEKGSSSRFLSTYLRQWSLSWLSVSVFFFPYLRARLSSIFRSCERSLLVIELSIPLTSFFLYLQPIFFNPFHRCLACSGRSVPFFSMSGLGIPAIGTRQAENQPTMDVQKKIGNRKFDTNHCTVLVYSHITYKFDIFMFTWIDHFW